MPLRRTMKAFRAHQQSLPPPVTSQAYPSANTYGQNYQAPTGNTGGASAYYQPPAGPPPTAPQATYRSDSTTTGGKYMHNGAHAAAANNDSSNAATAAAPPAYNGGELGCNMRRRFFGHLTLIHRVSPDSFRQLRSAIRPSTEFELLVA